MTFMFAILLGVSALAADVAKPNQGFRSQSSANAPKEFASCKPEIDPKSNTEEAFAKVASEKADASKAEILARLIFSEALSTGYWNGKCNANSDTDIMTGIGWGIMNRVRGKTGSNPYSDVIFGKSQFRTSFSGKKENPFAEAFLCPGKSQKYLNQTSSKASATALYKRAQDLAENIIREYEATKIPAAYNGITNFFYPQSEFFGEMRPSWAPEKDAPKNKGYMNLLKVDSKPCVEFYKLR